MFSFFRKTPPEEPKTEDVIKGDDDTKGFKKIVKSPPRDDEKMEFKKPRPIVNFKDTTTPEIIPPPRESSVGISLVDRKKRIISVEDILDKRNLTSEPPKAVYISKSQRLKNKEEEEKRKQMEIQLMEERLKRKKREMQQKAEYDRERQRKERQRMKENELIKQERERRDDKLKQDNTTGVINSDLAYLNLLKLPEKDIRATIVEKELEQIREYYLGLNKEKKKIQKPSEKFKTIFNFEWDESEDTTRNDNNPIYQNRPEPQLLFGRGFRAGIDRTKKKNNFYDELLKRRSKHPEWADTMMKLHAESKLRKAKDLEDNDSSNTHWTQKKYDDMTDRDWRIFREDFDIYIKGGRVPPPIRTWAESPLPWELLEAIKKAGYNKPTPIQMQAIPIALEMRDLIGIAVTGSGKTAAFVLPMLTYVKSLPPLTDETSQDGPYALILAPTRELALQIFDETNKFATYCKCRTVAVVGGRSAEAQAFELRRGAEVIVGTPGRIKDCLDRAYTVLNQCNYVILDEADRMIDMGFEDVVNDILDCIPTTNLKNEDEATALEQELSTKAGHRRYRITQMFSATMPPAVEKLTK